MDCFWWFFVVCRDIGRVSCVVLLVGFNLYIDISLYGVGLLMFLGVFGFLMYMVICILVIEYVKLDIGFFLYFM